jgi:aspartate-semialdehyde dehydrogenase
MGRDTRIGVVGGTGAVGTVTLGLLAEHGFDDVRVFASARSAGREVQGHTVEEATPESLSRGDVDVFLFSIGTGASRELVPHAVAGGAIAIDKSAAYRLQDGIPLVVPEVNGQRALGNGSIIANPNCCTIPLTCVLKPLHEAAGLSRVRVATYQSVSGAGKDAMDELFTQTRAVFVTDPVEHKKFPKRIAFNLIPQVDVFMEDGFTREEWKMVAETKKILDLKIKLVATCVRVPVFVSHSEAVAVEFENPISADEARDILREAPGCQVLDKREDGGYITPLESAGEDATFISRIREDSTVDNGLSMWVVSDNLRKGAALNAVQIAELLVERGLIQPKKKAA